MNDLSVVDTHVHLWDLERTKYPWLEDLPQLHATHGLDEYDAALDEVPVEQFVFVECTVAFDDEKSREEVAWVMSLAEEEPRLQGIVAHASLEKGAAVGAHLEWLATQPLVKGVRRLLQAEPEAFFRQPAFVEGVQMLADFDFSFDLTVRAPQLPATIELVDRCPQVEFVLDHLGKPNIREQQFEAWSAPFEALANRPNVTCKVSGVLTEADQKNWTPETVQPYIEHAIQCFGFDRLMFGGDWPVVRLAATYPEWFDVIEAVLHDASAQQKDNLFRANAQRAYRLETTDSS